MKDLLGVSFLLFILGGIGGMSCGRLPKIANVVSHGGVCLGGIFGAITSLGVLLSKNTMVLSAWHIIPDIALTFRVDGLSAFFLMIISVLAVAVSIYSIGYVRKYEHRKNIGILGAGMNLFLLSMVAVVTVDNGFSFLLSWELMSLVSLFLVMVEHEKPEVRRAGLIYVVMTHFGTLFITLSFLTFFLFSGNFQFSAFELVGPQLSSGIKNIIFWMALIGFGTKAGLIPLHIWLPRAHPAAPSHVSTLMSAVMIKTAVYGFIRVSYDFLGGGPAWWGAVVLIVGVVSAVVGILYGLAENDMKRFLAYSSVENMGIIFMGMGSSLIFYATHHLALGALALTAALMHTMNHALFKGVLFMGAGAVHYATGTKNSNQLGGLIRTMPWTAGLFLVGGMALAALPPLNGFVSEWATFHSFVHLALDLKNVGWKMMGALAVALLGLTGALVAAGVVKQFGVAFLGMPRTLRAGPIKEVPLMMRMGMALLAFGIVLLGIWPGLAIRSTEGIVGKYFGTSIQGDTLLYLPFADRSQIALSLGGVLILFLTFLFLSLLLLRLWIGKSKKQVDETWNCGMPLQSSMQYTGTSYSHPVVMIFGWLYRPQHQVEVQREYTYFPKQFRYRLRITALIESKLYRPLVKGVIFVSARIRLIQNGNLQGYLAYMMVTLLLLLLWFCR